jgi:hypothetical protein
MSDSTQPPDWSRHVAADGLFEVYLPPGAALNRGPASEPGGSYLYWSPPAGGGTFSIARAPAPGKTPEELLDLESRLGTDVNIELDETIDWGGQPARRLRYRVVEMRPRETIEDPVTGLRHHLPERRSEEVVDFLFWTGTEALRAGYRLSVDAPADVAAVFVRMRESFRILEEPRVS